MLSQVARRQVSSSPILVGRTENFKEKRFAPRLNSSRRHSPFPCSIECFYTSQNPWLNLFLVPFPTYGVSSLVLNQRKEFNCQTKSLFLRGRKEPDDQDSANLMQISSLLRSQNLKVVQMPSSSPCLLESWNQAQVSFLFTVARSIFRMACKSVLRNGHYARRRSGFFICLIPSS